MKVELESGVLSLNVAQADLPLEQLCGFASRFNPKRGYLFVSKVLGKHYPVRPRVMSDVYQRLANKLPALDGPVVVIGMAETATALSQGVYESWLARLEREGSKRDDLLYCHTTRYALDRPLALEFDEPHSHAPQHLLYEPDDPRRRRLFENAKHLVLIDDEISTGATSANLARAYREKHPQLESLQIVSLKNWLTEQAETVFRETAEIPSRPKFIGKRRS